MALDKSLALAGPLFPQRVEEGEAGGGRGVTLKWVFFVHWLPLDIWAESVWGTVVAGSLGKGDAVKGWCPWGRLSRSWPAQPLRQRWL